VNVFTQDLLSLYLWCLFCYLSTTDVALESSNVFELDLSAYFQDLDSSPLNSDLLLYDLGINY